MIKMTHLKTWTFFIIYLVAFSLFFPFASKAEGTLNVMDFGAIGNGETDDTKAIQDAINFQSKAGGGTVKIPKGIYLINTNNSVVLKSNVTLEFEGKSVLRAIPNDRDHYEVIRIIDVENVKILGALEIEGDRDNHLGKTGEWGFGISIRGSNNIVVENPYISNCWGDGIYIGSSLKQNYSENVSIINATLNNNRRQGISIISAKKLDIINAHIIKTNGTLPESGIDIEPNNSKEFLKDIRIINLSTKNNAQYGLKIFLRNLRSSENPVNIYVDSVLNITDDIAVKEIKDVRGSISIGGYYYLSEKEVIAKPLISEVTNNKVVGTAPVNSTVTVIKDTTVLGKAKINSTEKFEILLPQQKNGSALTVIATDIAGNVSKETIVTVKVENFTDMKSTHWFYNEVLYLREKRIIEGFPNGSFQPNKSTTRAEVAKMLATSLNISSPSKKTEYSDVEVSHWAKTDIAAVTAAGFFDGYPDGSFRPDKNITRAEMAKVLASAYNFKSSSSKGFKDVANTHWASLPILGLSQNKVANGFPDGTFRPNAATTRAEFSVFLARALNKNFR